MDERSDGLIIRTRPLTETSLVAHWLTPELGRIATVAKGARRAKSKFRGRLDLMQQAKFSFHRSRRSELHTLTEIEQLRRHDSIRKDVTSLRLMAYATRLVEQTTETENPKPSNPSLTGHKMSDMRRQSKREGRVCRASFQVRVCSAFCWGGSGYMPHAVGLYYESDKLRSLL